MDDAMQRSAARSWIHYIQLDIHHLVWEHTIFVMYPDLEDIPPWYGIGGNTSPEGEAEVWIIVVGRSNDTGGVEIGTKSGGNTRTCASVYIADGRIYREAEIAGKWCSRSSAKLNGTGEDESRIRERLDHGDDRKVGGDGKITSPGTHTASRASVTCRTRAGRSPIKAGVGIKVTTGAEGSCGSTFTNTGGRAFIGTKRLILTCRRATVTRDCVAVVTLLHASTHKTVTTNRIQTTIRTSICVARITIITLLADLSNTITTKRHYLNRTR